MPLSTDVNLPRDHKPVFPDRCIRCRGDHAGKTIRLFTHTVGWYTWIFWMFGNPYAVRVPACGRCGWMIRIQRMGSLAACLAIALIFLFGVWPNLEAFFHVPRPLKKWIAMIMILICLAPQLFWELIFPPSINLTAFSKSVDFEFRDESDAIDFATENLHAAWVKVEGEQVEDHIE